MPNSLDLKARDIALLAKRIRKLAGLVKLTVPIEDWDVVFEAPRLLGKIATRVEKFQKSKTSETSAGDGV